jgi:hypothetical protein
MALLDLLKAMSNFSVQHLPKSAEEVIAGLAEAPADKDSPLHQALSLLDVVNKVQDFRKEGWCQQPIENMQVETDTVFQAMGGSDDAETVFQAMPWSDMQEVFEGVLGVPLVTFAQQRVDEVKEALLEFYWSSLELAGVRTPSRAVADTCRRRTASQTWRPSCWTLRRCPCRPRRRQACSAGRTRSPRA